MTPVALALGNGCDTEARRCPVFVENKLVRTSSMVAPTKSDGPLLSTVGCHVLRLSCTCSPPARRPDAALAFDVNVGDAVGEVVATPDDLRRVIINLLDNAFDAVRDRAEAEGEGFEPAVTVTTRRQGDTVDIRVTDNGPGISADRQARVFEPFYTTKPAGEGTGLGLSLSYDIVTLGHGGTLAVTSEPPGATFVLTLPAARPDAAPA